MKLNLQAFDYACPPPSGLYWVAGSHPMYDFDVDDQGKPIGWPTGEDAPFVALAWIDSGEDDRADITPFDKSNTGMLDDTCSIAEFAAFALPTKQEMLSTIRVFDAQVPPEDLCWVFGLRADGATPFSALAWLSLDGQGVVEFAPFNDDPRMGVISNADWVTHYAPFELPEYPAKRDSANG